METEIPIFKIEEDSNQSLLLKIINEIVRMRYRLTNISDEINGIPQLSKSLDRIQEELNTQGYEFLDLLNQNYNPGMTIRARLIVNNDIPKGSQIITKILQPQVTYKGQLIQIGSVEVSINE